MPLKLQFWRRPGQPKALEKGGIPGELHPDTFNIPARSGSLDRLRTPKPKKVKRFKPTGKVDYRTLESAFRSWDAEIYEDYQPKPGDSEGQGEQKQALGESKRKEDRALLWKAFNVMRRLHAGQMRKDGRTKAEVHPFNVALYAAQAGCSAERVAAALLHDTLEDCNVSYKQLQQEFGGRVMGIVSLLSAPKVRLEAAHPWRTVRLSKDDGSTTKIPLVDAAHEQYAPFDLTEAQLEKIKELENQPEIREAISDYQRKQLMPDDSPITDTHWDAIWIKQFDALHNLQTLKGLPPKKRRDFVSKSTDMAGFLFEKISPVILDSVPRDVRKLLEELRREKGLDREDPHDWIVHLPDTYNLTYGRLMKLPRAHAEVVNRHHVVEANAHGIVGVSKTKHRIFIPNSVIGEGEDAFQKFLKELKKQLDPQAQPFSGPRSSPAPSKLVARGRSEIPAGLGAFHAYYINLQELPEEFQNLEHLKRALKNSLVRYSRRPLIDLAQVLGKRKRFIDETEHRAYHLQSPASKNIFSLFLPYKHFGRRAPTAQQLKEVALAVSSRRRQMVSQIEFETPHEPIPSVKRTFHTVNIQFNPDARLGEKKKRLLLAQVSGYLKPLPWHQHAYKWMEWGFDALDKKRQFPWQKKKAGEKSEESR